MPHAMLAALPYAQWKATKTTLHLMCQIVGKIRLGYVPHRSHWWNITLQPTPRGLSTMRMRQGSTFFALEFDFIDHRLIVTTNRAHEPGSIALRDGLTIAEFYAELFARLRSFGLDVHILDKPYGMPFETPFSEDREHASYDRVMVRRWWEALLWSADVFDQFASSFVAKESPAHLFWHGFDLAMGRYSGRPSASLKDDPIQQEAYSHEVIAVGFWPGDDTTPAPTYYTYTAPEPPTLTQMPLRPVGAAWYPSGAGHIGALPYDVVAQAADPRATLLEFLAAGYEAGVRSGQWDEAALRSSFAMRAYRADT